MEGPKLWRDERGEFSSAFRYCFMRSWVSSFFAYHFGVWAGVIVLLLCFFTRDIFVFFSISAGISLSDFSASSCYYRR